MKKNIYFQHPVQGKTALAEIKADVANIEAKNNSASMDKLAFSANTVKGLVAKIEELDALVHPQNSPAEELADDMLLFSKSQEAVIA